MPRKARYTPGGLVYHVLNRAEDWRWGSLWVRRSGPPELKGLLSDRPCGRPERWVETVNRATTRKDLESLRTCIQRGRPFGDEAWQMKMASQLGLMYTICSKGRPRKRRQDEK